MLRHLLILSGLGILAVVIHHSTPWIVTASIWWADRFSAASVPDLRWVGSIEFYLTRTIDQIFFFAVPVFLLISGYFMAMAAGRSGGGLTWRMILVRSLALVVPYLLWSALLVAMNVRSGVRYDALGLVRVVFLGEAAGPYYYVPMLIQLYLLSFWIVPAARHHGSRLLVLFGLVSIAALLIRYPLILNDEQLGRVPFIHFVANWQLLVYAVWFVGGAVLAYQIGSARQALLRWRWVLVFGLVATLLVGFAESELVRQAADRTWLAPEATLVDNLFVAFLILTYLTYEDLRLPGEAAIGRLGAMAFGVYLMHVPVLEVTARSLYHVAPGWLAYPGLLLLIFVAAGVGVPVLTMTAFRRTPLRRIYPYVFG